MEKALRASVVVALRNAPEGDVESLLAALRAQTLSPTEFEVVIALADSDREIDGVGLALRIVSNPGLSAATGLNRAVSAAGAPFVIRLDARTLPAPDHLEASLRALEETGAACVGGPMVPRGEGLVGRSFASLTSGYLGTGGAAFRHPPSERRDVDTVYLGAWPREALVAAGGFDESLDRNQDDELARRLRQRGGRIVLDPAIRSTYRVREGFIDILRQYFRYGLDKPAALRGHLADIRLRQLAPPLLVSFLLLLAGSAAGGSPIAPGVLLLLLVLHPVAGALTAPTSSWSERLVAGPLTMGIHLAYGVGVLLGIPRLALIPARRPGLEGPEETS